MSSFVHLHVHSQHSILDASASVADLVKKATAFQMPALAITDHGNMIGAIDFYKYCKDAKIKPILGCELYVAPTSRHEKKKITGMPTAYHLTLLAKNLEGFRNLCKLSSIGYTEGFYYSPRIDFDLLKKHAAGLICLSGCLESQISSYAAQKSKADLVECVKEYKEIFNDDFYLEVSRHTMSSEDLELEGMYEESWLYQRYQEYVQKQQKVISSLVELSNDLKIPMVATNNIHYIEREDWKAHEILLNIQSGETAEIWERDANGAPKFRVPNPRRLTFPSHEFFFKSPQEMALLFQDLPECLSNTFEIAEKCFVELDFKTKHYPVYIPPGVEGTIVSKEERTKAVEGYLRKLCEEGISNRYTCEKLEKVREKYPQQDPLDVVKDRLEYEMKILTSREMCDYLLIVWDFIHWAKNHGIPMGPGRGSGAGSIVLYLTGITDIEPLRFNLFFERFINPERISYPDIDVDICMERRGEVIHYTIEKYGKDNVAQIITLGTMKARMAVKDVGRVLNVPLTKVNSIAKLIPEDLNITLEKALEKDPELKAMYLQDEDAKKIIDIGKKLEGSIRNTSTHAAGMIISGEPLTEHIPICIAKDSAMLVTQYTMKPVEMVGMLKIDFLGLKTLTCIKTCIDSVKKNTTKEIDWTCLPLDDENTFSLLNQGRTQGVFQLESGGMQDLSKQLHLDKFEEIIAVISLYRPGPMEMIPSFIQRKHGQEPIEYDHPWMKEILAETYGIMVYQEQVMQIASKLANYSLGEGDVLRRAMGKKDMNEMTKQREKFVMGASQNGIDTETSTRIFDKMEKFAEYGFNKSHAAAYGYLTYVTAYLKANYAREWLAALMTCDRDDVSKVAKFTLEGRHMGIPILPPDINESQSDFLATKSGIRFALDGIKGVGTGVVEAIIEERNAKGSFKNLYTFIKRIDTKRVSKKSVELLVEAGCFDFTSWHRDALILSLDAMFDQVVREQKELHAGVLSLFAPLQDEDDAKKSQPPKLARTRSHEELLFREKELLGFFLTGHPLDAHLETLKKLGCISFEKFPELAVDTVFRTAFLVEVVQTRISSKTQKKFAILTISDSSLETYELPVWPEQYEEKGHLLIENKLLLAVLVKEQKNNELSLSCKWLGDLKQLNENEIQACDAAYDKTKQGAKRFRTHMSSKTNTKTKTMKEETAHVSSRKKQGAIDIDLVSLRLSHVLAIKKIFAEHKGITPIEIRFLQNEQISSSLLIDALNGISWTDAFEEKLKNISSVISVSFVC